MSNTMTTPTTIHDSTTCQANAGEPCDMCEFALDYELRNVVQRVQAEILDEHSFDDHWKLAPLSMTRTTERECAEYWYEQGKRAERRELLTQQNSDLREMLRVGNERVMR